MILLSFSSFYCGYSSEKSIGSATSVASTIIRGPSLSMITQNSVMISWWTKNSGSSIVHYGTNQTLEEQVINSESVTNHEIKLNNLEFNSTYFYQVDTDGTKSNIYQFKTAPGFSDTIKFIIYGDNRGGTDFEQPDVFSDIVANMGSAKPDLIFALGDLIHNDDDYESDLNFLQQQWDAFFDVIDDTTHEIPWIYIIGNHDAPDNFDESSFTEVFVQPKEPDPYERYFSFDYGPVHFIVLDTEYVSYQVTGDQWEWLQRDLAENRQSLHTFILMHKPLTSPYIPPYWISQRGLYTYPNLGQKFQELCENHSVTGILAAHDHMYHFDLIGNRNLSQIVSAAAGAPLYAPESEGGIYHHVELEVDWKTIFVKVVNSNGSIFDEYKLNTPYDLKISSKTNIESVTLSSSNMMPNDSLSVISTVTGTYTSDVRLFYSYNDLQWQNTSMKKGEQEYNVIIDDLQLTENGRLYILAQDTRGNVMVSDLYPFTVRTEENTSTTTTLSTSNAQTPAINLFIVFIAVFFLRERKRKKS
jgi:hypothetical protein